MPRIKISLSEIKQRIFKIHNNIVALDETTYTNTDAKCRFIDKEHGEWWAIPRNIYKAEHSHPKRKAEKIKQTCQKRYGINNPAQLQKNLKYNIDICQQLANKKQGICLSETYTSVKDYYLWKCEKGHQWKAKLNKIQQGRWCPSCYNESRTITTKKCVDLANKNNGKFLSLLPPQNSKEKSLWLCNKNHEFYMNYNNIHQNQWCPICAENKRIQTRIKRYGFPYLQQNKELALKSSRTKNEIISINHWKSNLDICCRGSYELAVATYLNNNKINFLWQPKTFIMPNNKTYTPDLFLTDKNKWIEIKGYWYDDAKEKWDWFHQTYPNSELWDKNKLKELSVL